MFRIDEHRSSGQPAAIPRGPVEARRPCGHFRQAPTPFVLLPSLVEATEAKEVLRIIHVCRDFIGRARDRAAISFQRARHVVLLLVQARQVEPGLYEIPF
ncbi:MAG: hypothetical protein A3G81_33355 [Betaproteobacteria bacterium RIFCSPLOWO2_12_FULL_65_14]|nr:MAG: hypothetical protein A3G81_33355 [Betaproteobacteria bacterium RIFCSPLOWO2_12_FULL_65_14]